MPAPQRNMGNRMRRHLRNGAICVVITSALLVASRAAAQSRQLRASAPQVIGAAHEFTRLGEKADLGLAFVDIQADIINGLVLRAVRQMTAFRRVLVGHVRVTPSIRMASLPIRRQRHFIDSERSEGTDLGARRRR